MKKKNKKDYDCGDIVDTVSSTKPCVCEIEMKQIDFNAVVEDLYHGEYGVHNSMIPAIAENGFTSEDGFIAEVGESKFAAFIPAKAMQGDNISCENASCLLVNTINDGFHYASVNDQNECVDMGKVVTPCIVGNVNKPSGVFIPFNNFQSVINGYMFMENMAAKAIELGEQHGVVCKECASKGLPAFKEKF